MKTLWYAVSKREQGLIFTSCPVRLEKIGTWSGHIEGCYSSVVCDMVEDGLLELPHLNYEDEPVKLKLVISDG